MKLEKVKFKPTQYWNTAGKIEFKVIFEIHLLTEVEMADKMEVTFGKAAVVEVYEVVACKSAPTDVSAPTSVQFRLTAVLVCEPMRFEHE